MVGIELQSFLHLQMITLFVAFAFIVFVLVIIHIIKSINAEVIKSYWLFLAILTFGFVYYAAFTQTKIQYPFTSEKYSNAKIIGTINKIELSREGRITFYLVSDSVITKDMVDHGKYNLLCSVYDDSKKIEKLYNGLSVGNKINLIGVVRKPRDERNPGEFDYEKYLNSKGIVALINIYNADDVKIISNDISLIKNSIFQIRKIIDKQITSLHNKTTAALLRGLILADRSLIDYQINDYFINAGVVHVLSVSGLHVGYIVLIFLVVFNRFNVYTRYTLTFIGLLFYLVLTGADAPVFRSTVMAFALLAAPATGREYNSLNSLSLSAFIILLISPRELFNPSFQLSFSAILSLIIIYPPLKKFIDKLNIKPKVLNWLVVFCMTSFAAQLGTLPFTLTYFHRLSISAFAANLVVIPVSGAIVGLGILTIVIGSISSWFGLVLGSANELMTYFMYFCVQLLGSGKLSYVSINQFSPYDAIIFYLMLALIFFILKKFSNSSAKIIGTVLSIFLMVLLMQFDNYELLPKNILSVAAVDVGQGDAILIKFPNGKTALIDAGNATPYFDNGDRIILPLLNKLGIDTVDYGFISHVDSDHYKGFISLIKNGRIKIIYKPKLDINSGKDVELEKYLRTENIPIKYYSKEIISIGNTRIYVLNDTTKSYFEASTSNDKSGMLKMVYGSNSFLFTGDAGVHIESDYVEDYKTFLHADVLKAGHHGSKNSTSDQFLDYVRPQYAVISAGVMNMFHHPNKEILDKFYYRNVKVLRTDKSCSLVLQSDGSKLQVIDWKRAESLFNF